MQCTKRLPKTEEKEDGRRELLSVVLLAASALTARESGLRTSDFIVSSTQWWGPWVKVFFSFLVRLQAPLLSTAPSCICLAENIFILIHYLDEWMLVAKPHTILGSSLCHLSLRYKVLPALITDVTCEWHCRYFSVAARTSAFWLNTLHTQPRKMPCESIATKAFQRRLCYTIETESCASWWSEYCTHEACKVLKSHALLLLRHLLKKRAVLD